MTWLIFLLTPFILFFWLSAMCLPFLCSQNRKVAVLEKRSIYSKGAEQLATLTRIICYVLGILFLADYFFHGRIMVKLVMPYFLSTPFLILGSLLLLEGLLIFIVSKTKDKTANFFRILTNILATCLIYFVAIFSFSIMRALIIPVDWSFVDLFYTILIQNTHPFEAVYGFPLIFTIYLIFIVFLGFFSAHLLALLFFICRRNSDDYGRDYYNILLTSHAKRALIPGFIMCILLPLIILVTNLSQYDIVSFVHFFYTPIEQVELGILQETSFYNFDNLSIIFTAGIIFIPVAVLLLRPIAYAKSKGRSPLQKKSYAFFSFFFLIIGLLFLLFRMVH